MPTRIPVITSGRCAAGSNQSDNRRSKMKEKLVKYLVFPALLMAAMLVIVSVAQAASGYVDPTNKWAWGTNIGWINFAPTHGGVTVYDDHLEGYAWAENVGWIRLGTYTGGGAHTYANNAANTYGVNNDGAGNLSGYAWGANIGWINFNPTHSQVTINPSTGSFDGYAWGENVGWIHFKNSGANAYNVVVAATLKVLTGGVTASGQAISQGAVIYGGVSEIKIEFNKNVNNPALSSDLDDVTNPANYLLFQKGADGVYDTVDCGSVPGVDPKDVKIPVGPVGYSNGGGSGPFVAKVTVNNGGSLPVGEYRLYVCGTTSIVDLNGIPLAGDNVTSGTDLVITFNLAEGSRPGSGNGAGSTVSNLPATGFAPHRTTLLPAQPPQAAYAPLGNLWLEIPSLGVRQNIVGVPQTSNGWDVTWLGNDIGYLDGTAFPTWDGNSVITAHVTDSNGLPGPFADIKSLKYGEQIIVHLFDEQYIFEIRNKRLVRPETTDFAFEHLEDHSYLTLITCQSYDPATDSYRLRRVIRAVLVKVEVE
ncbi:MAG: sortase [Anaerolineales bacterium]|nr:sortase [Anaerolineales bacterium]